MDDKIKKELDKFISENYNKLKEIANALMQGKGNPDEAISAAYLTIIKAKTHNGIRNAIKRNNLFNFFFVSLRNQIYGKTTLYNKEKGQARDIPERLLVVEDVGEDEMDNDKILIFHQVKKIVTELYNKEKIDWYEYHLFMLYYYPEDLIDIKNLSKKETDKLRKQSYQTLSKKTGIHITPIYTTVRKVLNMVINKAKQNNIL